MPPVVHAESCPLGRALLAQRCADAERLGAVEAFTRPLMSAERQELAVMTGRLVPRRDRKRWRVAVRRAPRGGVLRAFVRDGQPCAVVQDPPPVGAS